MMPRLLTLGWLACLTGALWIAALTPEAKGYELALEDAYPPVFWALTIGAGSLSASIPLLLAARQTQSRWWVSGLLGIMATNMFISSLPLFRGYPVHGRADPMNHIGYARDILASGTISDLDFYPAQHILQVALETIAGVASGTALVVLNLPFAVVPTIGTVLLVRRLSGDVRASYVAAAFSGPLALLSAHLWVEPNIMSAMLLPLMLAFHVRSTGARGWDRVANSVVEVCLALLLVFFHPMTTLSFLGFLLAAEAASRLYTRLPERFRSPGPQQGIERALGLAAIVGVTFIWWYSSFAVIRQAFWEVIRWLMGEQMRASAMSEAVSQIEMAQLPFADLVSILLNEFGLAMLVFGATCAFVAVLAWSSLRRRRLPPHAHVSFVAVFVAAIAVMISMFFLSTAERAPLRLMRFVVILGLCGLAWWCWESVFASARPAHWPRLGRAGRMFAMGTMTALLLAMVAAGQLNVYAHPRNGRPNEQVTNGEISGMRWLLDHQIPGARRASIVPDYVPNFQAYFLGYAGQQTYGPGWWQPDIWLPTHFYDPGWKCIAEVVPGETAYLILSERGRVGPLRFPESVRHLAHTYTEDDWQRLASDPSVNKFYDNGGFEVWVTQESTACR